MPDQININDLFGDNFNKELKDTFNNLSDIGKLIDKVFNKELKKARTQADALAKDIEKTNSASDDYNETLKEQAKVLKANEKQQEQLTKAQTEYQASLEQQGKSVNTLKKELKLLTEQYNAIDQETKQGQKTAKTYATQITKVRDQLQQLNKATKTTRDELTELDGTYEAASKRLAQLRQRLKQIPNAFDETTGEINKANREVRELSEEINTLDKQLKGADASIGQFQRNVGSYQDAIKGAASETTGFLTTNEELSGVLDTLNRVYGTLAGQIFTVDKAQDAATASSTRFGRSLRRIGRIIKGSGIALLATIIGAIGVNFTQTEEGADTFSDAIARVTATFTVLLGRFAEFGGAVIELFKNLADDPLNARDAFKEFGNDVKDIFTGVGDAIDNAIDSQLQINKLQRDFREEIRGLNEEFATLNGLAEQQQAIADDTTRSFAQREEAALRAGDAAIKAAQQGLVIADKELEIIQEQIDLRKQAGLDTRDLRDQESEAIVAQIEAQNLLNAAIIENDRLQRELQQDRLERDLDFAIDIFDSRKTLNERIIQDERTTQARRKELFDQTQKELERSLVNQLAIIQQFTAVQIDQQKLQSATVDEAIDYVRTLGLSEIIEGRVLEIVRERNAALQDVADLGNFIEDQERSRLERLIAANNELERIEEARSVAAAKNDAALAISARERLDASKALADAEIGLIQQTTQTRLDEKDRELALLEQRGETDVVLLEAIEKEKQAIIEQSELEIQQIRDDSAQEQVEIQRQLNQETLDTIAQTTQLISSLFSGVGQQISSIFQLTVNDLEFQLDQLDERFDEQIDAAGDNSDAIQALEEDRAAKRQALEEELAQTRIRQAKLEKAITAVDIVTKTAAGIATATATYSAVPLLAPLLPGIIALIAATGAAQLATVLAAPIPAFAEGVDSAPSGLALVGEAGPELVVTNQGDLAYIDKPNILDLKGGEKIYNAEETEMLLRAMAVNDQDNYMPIYELQDQLNRRDAAFLEKLDNQRMYNFTMTRDGIQMFIKTKNSKTELLNHRYR